MSIKPYPKPVSPDGLTDLWQEVSQSGDPTPQEAVDLIVALGRSLDKAARAARDQAFVESWRCLPVVRQ